MFQHAGKPAFQQLSAIITVRLVNCCKWSFSVLFRGPFRTSFGDHFGLHLETISDLVLDRELNKLEDEPANSLLRTPTLRTRARPRIQSLTELPLHSSQV